MHRTGIRTKNIPVCLIEFHRCLLIIMSQTSSKDSHLSQDAYFKCTHKCLLFNWIILILSYTLIGYLIADIHIYKLLIYPICEGIYYTDRISDLYSYILYPIGQALWNRDWIYIVIDICLISEDSYMLSDRTYIWCGDQFVMLSRIVQIGHLVPNSYWH